MGKAFITARYNFRLERLPSVQIENLHNFSLIDFGPVENGTTTKTYWKGIRQG